MEEHGIVPDVIKVAPTETIEISFGTAKVNMGNELTPTQVQNPPTLMKWNTEAQALYTLCVVDPDAPSRKNPKFREWHHWLVVNIPGIDVSKGETLSEYIGAAPPQNTGLHRYVYLIYKQSNKIDTQNIKKLSNKCGSNRGKFSIKKFAEQHKLGNPVAGNFFQAQFDDYVLILNKQLQGK